MQKGLSFKQSEVNVVIKGKITSGKNLANGSITADRIGNILIDTETQCEIIIKSTKY